MLGKILKTGGLFGALSGVMFIVLFFTLVAVKTPLSSMLYRVDLGLMIFFSYLAVYYLRYYLNYGEMKLWQGFAAGSLVSLISALMISVAVKIYINPDRSDVLEKDIQGTINAMNITDSTGNVTYIDQYGQESYDEQVAELKAITPSFIVQDKFSSIAGIGLIFSFVFSVFLRKQYDQQV